MDEAVRQPVRRHRFLDQLWQRFGIIDIEGKRHRATKIMLADQGVRPSGQIKANHPGAFDIEFPGDRRTQVACTTGDPNGFSLE